MTEQVDASDKAQIRCLVYNSSATEDLPESELFRILETAQTRNRANGVSGMLLYHEGVFLQVLEGPPEAVEETYRRNLRDRRHHGILPLIDKAVSARSFPSWSMSFRIRTDGAEPLPCAYSNFLTRSANPGELADVDPVVRALVWSFKDMFRHSL